VVGTYFAVYVAATLCSYRLSISY